MARARFWKIERGSNRPQSKLQFRVMLACQRLFPFFETLMHPYVYARSTGSNPIVSELPVRTDEAEGVCVRQP
jgi:hypothetical protein